VIEDAQTLNLIRSSSGSLRPERGERFLSFYNVNLIGKAKVDTSLLFVPVL